MTKTSCKFKVFEAIKSQYCSFHRFVVLYSSCIQSHFVLCTNCYHWWWFVWYFSTASVLGLSVRCVGIKMMWSSHINSPKLLYVKVWKYWNHIMCICFVMPLLLRLWAGIKIALLRPYVCTSVRMYNSNSCVCNSSYTPWWILFIPIHSDQHDMKMTVKIGFCDVASFTWVMGLCLGGHPGPTVTFLDDTRFIMVETLSSY